MSDKIPADGSITRERQRVAERFREIASDELIEHSLIKSLKEGAHVPQTRTWRDTFRALADLIDPTCHVTYEDEYWGDNWVFTRYRCKSCGKQFLTQSDNQPDYCPKCGARIVEVRG